MKKLLSSKSFLLTLGLLMGGVNFAWATVTATLSGMNQVGDYYYPVYTLSESSAISSFTSSNGSAPAAITDGTTLTFSHRGTVTLESGETFTGKKYAANEVGFHTLPAGVTMQNANSGKVGTMNGFTGEVYRKQNSSGIGNVSTVFPGFTISGSQSFFVYYAYSNSSYTGSPLGANFLNSKSNIEYDLTFTVNDDDIAVAILTYYHNSTSEDIAVNPSNLETEVCNREANDEMKFTIHNRSQNYYYQTLTTYTVVAETLSDVTATFNGLAETSGYYYPVYTITATHDEDGEINPSLAAGSNYDVAANVLTYTARTASTTDVNISYGGANSVAEVPASVKYRKTNYDFSQSSTFENKGANGDGAPSGFSSASSVSRFYIQETAGSAYTNKGITYGASQYKWTTFNGYGIGFSGSTSSISKSGVSDGSYAVLTWKQGKASDQLTWEGTTPSTKMVAAADGTVSFTGLLDKDTPDFCYYTSLDIYEPVSLTIVGTYALNESSFTKNDGYYYRQYTISASVDDVATDNFTLALVGGDATVVGKTVTYTGTSTATVRLTDTETSNTYDLELPASVRYLLTNSYELGNTATYPASVLGDSGTGGLGGFNWGSANRTVLGSKSGWSFDNLTFGSVDYGYYCYYSTSNSVYFGIQLSSNKVATMTFNNAKVGQVAVLDYFVGTITDNSNNGTNWSGRVLQQDVKTATGSSIAFSLKDKDHVIDTDKGYVYNYLRVYTPVSVASQTVTVNSAVGGMGTLVASYPMDFSASDGIKAYTATSSGTDGSQVVFRRINKVPANTPVLVYKEGGATANEEISFCNAEDADAVGENMLVAGTGAAVETSPEGYTNYILTTGDEDDYGFYYANGATVATNRAYLHVPNGASRLSIVWPGDEASGISTVAVADGRTADGLMYNLQGQRIAAPVRGLYIVNGKKVLKK